MGMTLVTESLTLKAGALSSPLASILYSRCTPVVVSSEMPLMSVCVCVCVCVCVWVYVCFCMFGCTSMCVCLIRWGPTVEKVRMMFVHISCEVASIIEDHVEGLSVPEEDRLSVVVR